MTKGIGKKVRKCKAYVGRRSDEIKSMNKEINRPLYGNECSGKDCWEGKDVFRTNRFPMVLSKIDEVEECGMKSPLTVHAEVSKMARNYDEKSDDKLKALDSPQVMWKSSGERTEINKNHGLHRKPENADSLENNLPSYLHETKKLNKVCATLKPDKLSSVCSRHSWSESNSDSSLISTIRRPRSAGWKLSGDKRACSFDTCLWESYVCPARPRSACCMETNHRDLHFIDSKGEWISRKAEEQPRKVKSSPNITRAIDRKTHNGELQIDKFRRSLKLLGLEVTDFGISDYSSDMDVRKCQKQRGKRKHKESTFSTKVIKRSVSLDGLKEIVRDAWLDDRLDSSHRKLLAQAAYEEWYFRKNEEAQRRLSDEKLNKKIMREKLENELKCRKLKAEEQFNKWIEGKKAMMKVEKSLKKPQLTQLRLVKTTEEVEESYRRWKKEKDKQIAEKLRLEVELKEKQLAAEKQKEEKKALAEMAFTEWKRKLVENEKSLAVSKLKKEKKKDKERKTKEQEKTTSFQTWKNMKDRELSLKLEEKRNALRIAKALSSAKMEERMYEAEQAFEEWLEKVESRESILKSKTAF